MFRYEGQFTYTTARSHRHGDLARITIEASLFGPRLTISIHDGRFDSVHVLTNARYDFKARDSHVDLRARDSWASNWVDCFRGPARLVFPRIDSAPQTIDMLIYASWDPAFVVIEFEIWGDYCSFATRCRPGSSGRWVRTFLHKPPPKMNQEAKVVEVSESSKVDDSTAGAISINASSSVSTGTNLPSEQSECAEVDFSRIVNHPKPNEIISSKGVGNHFFC